MTELTNNINPVEQEKRISICIECQYNVCNNIPLCTQCNIPISKLTSEQNETCPLNKW